MVGRSKKSEGTVEGLRRLRSDSKAGVVWPTRLPLGALRPMRTIAGISPHESPAGIRLAVLPYGSMIAAKCIIGLERFAAPRSDESGQLVPLRTPWKFQACRAILPCMLPLRPIRICQSSIARMCAVQEESLLANHASGELHCQLHWISDEGRARTLLRSTPSVRWPLWRCCLSSSCYDQRA